MANLLVEQKTIKELFQGSKYGFLIPDYQRPYEWEEAECKTLWDDLFNFSFPNYNCEEFEEESEYFLGPIVTFKNGSQMEVIDGQQRLTTLMLLLRAFYNKLGNMQDNRSKKMREDIEECIWKTNNYSEFNIDDLKINSQVATDEDKDEFVAILKDGKEGDKKSRYAKNFKFFVEQINKFLDDYPSYFTDFPARMLNNCVLLPIEASSQDTALRIFSTLNDRGKPLVDSDIFKAQLYKYYSSLGKKDDLIEIWKKLDKITSDVFTSPSGTPMDELFTRYMYYQRSLNGIKNTTVESLRKFYEGGGNYQLLRDSKTLDDLVCLAKFWQDVANQDDTRFSERVLKLLFVLNYAPNGMWTYITSVYFMHNKDKNDLLEEEAFCKFLNRITAFIWMYTIMHPGVSSLRAPIFNEMVKIVNDKEVDFGDFKFSENDYKDQFRVYNFRNSRAITKSMITWWAFTHENQELLSLETRFDIEHIYPQNRQEKEKGLKNPNNIELLGNKALLEKKINIGASDYHFKDKSQYYMGTVNSKKKESTKIVELKNLANTHSDFTEGDIIERNSRIIDSFINYLRQNGLLKDSWVEQDSKVETYDAPKTSSYNEGENTSISEDRTPTGKAKASRLRITFPNGMFIQKSTASETFCTFVEQVGAEKVRSMNLTLNRVPLISNVLDRKYKRSQKHIGNGLYLMTLSDTDTKKEIIEKIAAKFGMELKVEKIYL